MSSGKVALITGASAGLGKEFAKALLKEGYTVYAAARRIEKMSDIEAEGAIPLKMDITQDVDIQNVVKTITKDKGRIDVLINNAGYAVYGSVEETSIEDARKQFEVNLFGLGRLTQLVLPLMREQHAGRIINISSMAGKTYSPLASWYNATKHALEGWSDCLRVEVKQFNIDVVIIEPGLIKTEFADVSMEPLRQRSGYGPYAKLAEGFLRVMKNEQSESNGSDPSVITKLVVKAVRARRPKFRYAAGKYAHLMMFLRRWLSDSWIDKAILMSMK